MTETTIKILSKDDAHRLAPLIAAYAQAMRRGAPRRPDEYYAERLTSDRAAEMIGAFKGPELVGFAVFFDLPDTISGHRIGQLDDIYVLPESRHQGIGTRLIETLRTEGRSRGWARLRWIVPKPVDAAATGLPNEAGLYEIVGTPSSLRLYEITIEGIGG